MMVPRSGFLPRFTDKGKRKSYQVTLSDPKKDQVMGIPGTSSSTVEETIKGMWRTLSDDQKIHYSQLQSECDVRNCYSELIA